MRPARDLEVGTLAAQELPEILPLVEACYGRRAEPLAWWRWYHFDNPTAETVFFVARVGPQVVGMQPLAMGPARLGEAQITAGLLSGAMVHPEYRGRGIFRSLVGKCCSTAWARGLSWVATMPNDTSEKAFHAMGWVDPGDRTMLVHVGLLAGYGECPPGGGTVHEVDCFPEALDEVLATTDIRGGCAAFGRSVKWLNWRFGGNPLRSYRRFLCCRQGRPVGYAVTTVFRKQWPKVGCVMDLWALDESALLALGSGVRQSCMRDGTRILVAVASSAPLITQLKRWGFQAWPRELSPRRFHFVFAVRPQGAHEADIPKDISRWWLSLGDWDGL